MPRQAELDILGLIHLVMVRVIEGMGLVPLPSTLYPLTPTPATRIGISNMKPKYGNSLTAFS